MCTVTYLPQPDGFILSSNRDERIFRPTLPPQTYVHGKQHLTYPEDKVGRGSWIAGSADGRAACLLNGAFVKHRPRKLYRKSRGKVLVESFHYNSAEAFCEDYRLENVEPFTLLLLDFRGNTEITELRWDGRKKHLADIDASQPHIWSSVTLYDKAMRKEREKWFYGWLKNKDDINSYAISEFHTTQHADDAARDIMMQRSSWLRTVSLSQLTVAQDLRLFKYYDLLKSKAYLNIIKNARQLF